MEFVGRILSEAVQGDEDILGAAIFAPTGYLLGEVETDGAVHRENRNQVFAPWLGYKLEGEVAEFRFKIPANVKDCCECRQKGMMEDGGEYSYTFRLRVSPTTLFRDIRKVRNAVASMALCAAMLRCLRRFWQMHWPSAWFQD